MQREIKFRAWDNARKVMLESGCVNLLMYFDGTIMYLGKNEELKRVDEDGSLTLMQYTGLKDKNGKEIYEGDIAEYKDFSNGLYLFKEQPKAKGVIKINDLLSEIYLKGLGTFEGNKVEVIGNIYENPELLEVSHG